MTRTSQRHTSILLPFPDQRKFGDVNRRWSENGRRQADRLTVQRGTDAALRWLGFVSDWRGLRCKLGTPGRSFDFIVGVLARRRLFRIGHLSYPGPVVRPPSLSASPLRASSRSQLRTRDSTILATQFRRAAKSLQKRWHFYFNGRRSGHKGSTFMDAAFDII
jgi:hypothetical protein